MEKQFKVGQRWKSRDGLVVTVEEINADLDECCRIRAGERYYCSNGMYYSSGSETPLDLVELVQDVHQHDTEGWTTWNGGECPVPGDTLVDVRFRGVDYLDGLTQRADCWRWKHCGDDGDIVAYRVVTPNAEAIADEMIADAASLVPRSAEPIRGEISSSDMARLSREQFIDVAFIEAIKANDMYGTNREGGEAVGDYIAAIVAKRDTLLKQSDAK